MRGMKHLGVFPSSAVSSPGFFVLNEAMNISKEPMSKVLFSLLVSSSVGSSGSCSSSLFPPIPPNIPIISSMSNELVSMMVLFLPTVLLYAMVAMLSLKEIVAWRLSLFATLMVSTFKPELGLNISIILLKSNLLSPCPSPCPSPSPSSLSSEVSDA